MSSIPGRCFDIGNTILAALRQYTKTGLTVNYTESLSNGTLMRLSPIVLGYCRQPDDLVPILRKATNITHGNPGCVEASYIFGDKIVQALNGKDKATLLCSQSLEFEVTFDPLRPILVGEYGEVHGSGYVVDSLASALHCFRETDNFMDGALMSANLGNDSDTTGAIYGQIAGAFYGITGIPTEWIDQLYESDLIRSYAFKLYELEIL